MRSNDRASECVVARTFCRSVLGLPLQAAVPLGPAGVRLPVRAAVAGVRAQGPAQRAQLRVVVRRAPARAPPPRGGGRDDAGVAQRRRQVAAHRGRPGG